MLSSAPPVPPQPSADLALNQALPPELCVVIPTLNEQDNIVPLMDRLRTVLTGVRWEAILVDDDSTDGTRDQVRALAATDGRIRLLHRLGRRGLSSACIEGIQASTAPFVAVMDADLQHDEALVARHAAPVAGRALRPGGGQPLRRLAVPPPAGDRRRAGLSGLATRLGQVVLRSPVADPMSGFFMLRRPVFDRAVRRLSAVGFKILLDLLASSPQPLRVLELPFTLPGAPWPGTASWMPGWRWITWCCWPTSCWASMLPVRFVLFAGIGLLGLLAHLCWCWRRGCTPCPSPPPRPLPPRTAMVGNFALNNLVTFRDRRLRGWRLWAGLGAFLVLCGLGAAANVGVASLMFGATHASWWLSGIAGAAMSLVWNYAVSTTLIWQRS